MGLIELLDSEKVGGMVPARRAISRKGENGSVLVLGGSYTYHGAPILSSLAALRCGTDLVYTCVPKVNVTATRAASPNLIVIPLADQKLTKGAARKLLGALPKGVDSAAVGMGLAVQERGALVWLVESLLDRGTRVILDAAALVPEVLPVICGKGVVVTPHAGEFARLFGRAPPDDVKGRAALAQEMAAKHGITILLKGPTDIITDGSAVHGCDNGAPGMTVGGTGDVLSGLVAGMLARNRDPCESAAAAAFVNGLAGSAAQSRLGLHMAATDMVDELPGALLGFDRVE